MRLKKTNDYKEKVDEALDFLKGFESELNRQQSGIHTELSPTSQIGPDDVGNTGPTYNAQNLSAPVESTKDINVRSLRVKSATKGFMRSSDEKKARLFSSKTLRIDEKSKKNLEDCDDKNNLDTSDHSMLFSCADNSSDQLDASNAFSQATYKSPDESFMLEKKSKDDKDNIIEEINRGLYRILSRDNMPHFELRPEKIKVGGYWKDGKELTLAHIITENIGGKVRLNRDALFEYIKPHLGFERVQVHLPDLLIDPRTQDIDWFSITTGDIEKVGHLYLDLAEFLHEVNQRPEYQQNKRKIVIPTHLTNCEVYRNSKGIKVYAGGITKRDERNAAFRANTILDWLEEKFQEKQIDDIIIGLETGPGAIYKKNNKTPDNLIYSIMNNPTHFQFLLEGREDFARCLVDVAHLEFDPAINHSLFLAMAVAEYHISGNRKDSAGLPIGDEHLPATKDTLSCYDEIITLTKLASENIFFCAEMQQRHLSPTEYINQVTNFLKQTTEPIRLDDYRNWKKIEAEIKQRPELKGIYKDNLDEKRIGEVMRFG